MSKSLRTFGLLMPIMAVACSSGSTPGDISKAQPVTTTSGNAQAQHDKEIADATEAIGVDPKKLNDRGELAHYLRGRAYAAKNEHEQAIADFTAAITLYSEIKGPYYEARLAEAHSARGESYLATRDYDKAIADYTEVVESGHQIGDVNDVMAFGGFAASALYKRGVCYDEKGDREEALADFKEAIRRAPDLAKNEDLKRRMGE